VARLKEVEKVYYLFAMQFRFNIDHQGRCPHCHLPIYTLLLLRDEGSW